MSAAWIVRLFGWGCWVVAGVLLVVIGVKYGWGGYALAGGAALCYALATSAKEEAKKMESES